MEVSNNWGPRGLGYYLAANALWDVNVDSNALLQEFYDKAFGPAAKPMESFYRHWHGAGDDKEEEAPGKEMMGDGKEESVPVDKLKQMFRDLDEAAQLAKTAPDCLARVDCLRMYVHFLVLRNRSLQAAKAKGGKQALVDAVHEEVAFAGRLTNTNMIHSRALLGKGFSRRYKDTEKMLDKVPELQNEDKGWRARGVPPSHVEVELFWAADKKALQIE